MFKWIDKNKGTILVLLAIAFGIWLHDSGVDKNNAKYEAIGFAKGYDKAFHDYENHISESIKRLNLCDTCNDNNDRDSFYMDYIDYWQEVPEKQFD